MLEGLGYALANETSCPAPKTAPSNECDEQRMMAGHSCLQVFRPTGVSLGDSEGHVTSVAASAHLQALWQLPKTRSSSPVSHTFLASC